MKKIKLFCFPYAGGSAVIYNKWRSHLRPEIELVPVELAGRGRRIQDALYADVPEMIDDVFRIVTDELDNTPYALFGHSMGGMISFHLAQKLAEHRLPPPVHVFFSGRGAPNRKRPDKKVYHLMDDDQFRSEVMELGGTPPEFFEHPELVELFLPLLRNDFRMSETAPREETVAPLSNEISVFMGKKDDLTAEECDGWKFCSNKRCSIYYFNQGHFFLHDETEHIVKIINNILL
jgi:medium-chain acyl-[acyl-carrier-protein] hydrolase